MTRADLPPDVSCSPFGPRLQAEDRSLSFEPPRGGGLRRTGLGVPISLGSIHRIERQVVDALAEPYAQAWAAIRKAPVRNLDETGWREGTSRSWLWVAVSEVATGFAIACKRVVTELLGESLQTGFFGSDRWRAYDVVEMDRRGICHAHLRRDFVKIKEQGDYADLLGWCLLRAHSAVFELLNRRRAQEIDEERFHRELGPLKERMRTLLEDGARCSNKKVRGRCADILRHWSALWNFASVAGLAPTNNAAERALRKAGLWRKGSFWNASTHWESIRRTHADGHGNLSAARATSRRFHHRRSARFDLSATAADSAPGIRHLTE